MIDAFVIMEEKDGYEGPVFVSKDFAKAMAMSAVFNRDVKDGDGTVYSVVPAPSDFSLGPKEDDGE